MLPSSTVENYLKAIYHGVGTLTPPQRLVPMGHLAAALGVAPGTATTMVKTLAESGLVEYEPYAGVRLTPAGEKLAALVLRRHRLVELFLVQVMGLRWDEVHDEAELLEHVVSERLIDRMDEMLGRPETDPHGDPIPDPDGIVKAQPAETLLSCPLHTPVTVTRIVDQDKAFLRFVEGHDLKPGQSIEVEARDAAADSVQVRGKDDRRITLGTRAASKLLVQVARVVSLLLVTMGCAWAQATAAPNPDSQTPPSPSGSHRPWEISDNSFLVEEAFNQDVNTVQNIFGVLRLGAGDWAAAFTQEWPLFSHRHQISYTVAAADAGSGTAFGDALINYRYQVMDEGPRRPAFAPRVSAIVPSGSRRRDTGGDAGWQANLPFSKQFQDVYVHWNAGMVHAARLSSPFLAASGIWRARSMLNVMLETNVLWRGDDSGAVTRHEREITISPGFRAGVNRGDAQTVVGLALPIVKAASGETTVGVFAYYSYELPFRKGP